MTYQKALNELRSQAQKAYDHSDFQTWVEIGTAADDLESWIDEGQPGNCPVDLKKYNLELDLDDQSVPVPVRDQPLIENNLAIGEQPGLDGTSVRLDEPLEADAEDIGDSLDEEVAEDEVVSLQDELIVLDEYLPNEPRNALEHLNRALEKNFSEEDLRLLEEKKREVEALDAQHRKADDILSRVDEEADPLQVLRQLNELYSIFPYFPDLETRLTQTYEDVLRDLLNGWNEHDQSVQEILAADSADKYTEALLELDEASKLIEQWPLEEIPAELEQARARIEELSQQVQEMEAERANSVFSSVAVARESIVEEPEAETEEEAHPAGDPQGLPDAMLYKQLKEAQELFNQGEWRQALKRCADIESLAQDQELKERVAILKADAKARMARALSDILNQAHIAQASGDEQAARSGYENALKLDPENGEARQSLSKLDDLQNGNVLSQDEQDRLRVQLKEEKDIIALEEAVRKGEEWDAEGKLPSALVDLKKEARKRFDTLRTQMGQETTMAHFDDLEAVKQAWELAQDRLNNKFPYIFDAIKGDYVKTEEYSEEVDDLWLKKSLEIAQYELTIADNSLPDHPKAALKRLEQALAKPLHERGLPVLQEKKREVEKLDDYLISYQQPLLEDDPVKSLLSFSLPAVESDFPHFEFLQERKDKIYSRIFSRAVVALERTVQDCYDKVDIYLGRDTHEAYENAREEIKQAHKILDRWTLEEIPDELNKKRKRADELKEKLNARQALHNELHNRIDEIRALVQNPAHRKTGKKRFDELKTDGRFADFSTMASFTSEMDQYLDAGEQFVEAKLAKQKGDWRRVFEVTERLIREGGAGAFKDEVNALYEQAGLELDFARAKQYLDGNSVLEAKTLLFDLKLRSAKLKDIDNWHERLQEQLEWVRQCEDNSPHMEQRFSQALALIHFSGSPILKTYLDHSLEKGNLATLSDWNRDDQSNLRKAIGKGVNDPVTILDAIDGSKALLLATLERVSIKDKVKALRSFQMIQGSVEMDSGEPWTVSLRTRDAGKMALLLKESVRNHDLKTLLLAYQQRDSTKLDDVHIFDLALLASLLHEANLLETENERAAVRWYEVEQTRRRVRSWKNIGDWQSIQDAWAKLRLNHPGHPEVEDGWLEAKEKVAAIEKVLQELENVPSAVLGLKKLKDASATGITRDEPRILSKLYEKYNEISTKLIQTYNTEIEEGTEESISRAVIALHELEDVEKIYELAENEKKFNDLYAELENMVRRTHPDLAQQLPHLGELYRILQSAEDPVLWEQTIRSGNFGKLDAYWQTIANQNFNYLLMAQSYWNRLDEWRETHDRFLQEIETLRRFFEVDEDFTGIVKLINGNQHKPAQKRNSMPWQQLKPEDYSNIRGWMSDHLMVSDAYPDSVGNTMIVGWDMLKRIAEQRDSEYRQWKSWYDDMIQDGQSIITEFNKFKDIAPKTHLAGQQESLEKICRRAIALVEYIDADPGYKNGEFVSVHSTKAERLQLDSSQRKKDARKWLTDFIHALDQVNQQIVNQNGFPTPREFQDAASQAAQKNCTLLEMVLTRAETVGPGNSMLMDVELRNAVASARNNQFQDLKVLLGLIKELDDNAYPSWKEFETKLQQADSERLLGILQDVSVHRIYNDAVKSGHEGEFEPFKRYLRFAETVRSKRRQEEQDRIRTYKNILESCRKTPPTLFERITNLFGRKETFG